MTQLVASETIPVWPDGVPNAERWQNIGEELERPRRQNSRLVRNVSQPSLTVFLPDPSTATGTGMVVCPGGGFHFLMVDKEGTDVARWLNARGLAVFVLKYRLVPTPDDDDEFEQQASNLSGRHAQMMEVIPSCISDGQQALRVVRRQAEHWAIRPDRLGIMGFSAGGLVAAGAAIEYDADSRPSFAAPIYGLWPGGVVRPDAPPLFVAAATDDEQVAASESVSMYNAWNAAGVSCELHLYAQGGHGFALLEKGLPSDRWIDRFWEWLQAQNMVA